MSDELEALIANAVDKLREEGFEQDYIAAAIASYRENLQEVRGKLARDGMRLSASPPSKITSVTSVEDPFPKESIGWQCRILKEGESAPSGWVVVDD